MADYIGDMVAGYSSTFEALNVSCRVVVSWTWHTEIGGRDDAEPVTQVDMEELPVIKVNMNSAGSEGWLQVLQERLHC